MLKIDKNFSESKSQGLNVSVSFSCMMESQSFQDGAMARSEPSCHNQENYSTLSMTLIIMAALLLQQQMMELESSPEAPRDKLESGKSPNKLKLWRPRSNSTEAESGPFK